MSKRDFYDVLGVSKTASKDEIKSAYRKLAMKYHPDKNPGDAAAEEMFKEAAEAYSVLSDDEQRQKYDRFGHAGLGNNGGFSGMNMNDIFSDIFGAGSPFESFFGGGGGGRRSQRRQGVRGQDLRVRVKVTLEDVSNGVEKKIKLNRYCTCDTCSGSGAEIGGGYSTCPTCNGSGEIRRTSGGGFFQQIMVSACPQCGGEGRIVSNPCGTCNGEGREMQEVTETLKIPQGISEGLQISIRGAGHAGQRGGPAGDMIVLVDVETHEHFEREGDNIVYELYISFPEAALGTTVEVPTLGAKARFAIPAGTQSGKLVKLRGKGLPNLNHPSHKGDLLVHVNVWIPKSLTNEERKILEKFRSSENFQPSPGKDERSFFQRVKEFFS